MIQPQVEEIKSRLDIVQIVGETVTLKKSGKDYKGFCPFHNNTKTEALAVFPDTQTWKCFGSCGDGGDIFSWIMKRDNLDFKQALATLAARAGLNDSGHYLPKSIKHAYTDLADYAAAHGVTVEVFKGAGWTQTTHHDRPALLFKTNTGPRYRYLDGQDPKYWHRVGYKRCWYGLRQAVKLATATGQPLALCNGEASTVVAQYFGLAAAALAGGSEKPTIPAHLLAELQAAYTGPVIVALDCDDAGRTAAPKLAAQLREAGYQARAVDLALGIAGGDLADFCKLHQGQAAATLQTLVELDSPQTPTKDPEARIKSADYLAALKRLGYSFRLNVLDDTVEVNKTPITDTLAAMIRTRMRDAGYTKYLGAMEDAYITAAADNPFHPIKAYLESLQWDGQSHIDTLAGHFSDEQGVFALWLKKWLVGAVAKVYGPAQNPMLVLDGMQGRGKSYFAAWLCPPSLKKHFIESAIQPDNNDHKLLLVTNWIWEVSELGATTRKADREALKAFITLTDITARKPYGTRPINKPALASFIGTINDEAGFLNDPTGSRRFLPCTLTRIDWDYTKINRDNTWAEALHLYRAGYNWRLTTEEQKLQAEINEHYEIEDPLIPEVLRHYSKTDNPNDFVSSRDILTRLELNHLDTRNTMRLSRAMKKLGVTKTKQGPKDNRQNGYCGLRLLL